MKGLLKNKKILMIAAAAIVVVAVAAVVLLLLFPGGEVEETGPVPVEAPVQYALGEVQVFAMPAGPNVLVYEEELRSLVEEPEEETPAEKEELSSGDVSSEEESEEPAEEEEAASEEESGPERPIVAYRYEGMTSINSMVSAYVTLLTTEDMGYVFADKGLKETEDIPDFTETEGTAYLTYVIPEVTAGEDTENGEDTESSEETEPQAVAMRLEWGQGQCVITAELVPASLTVEPVAPPENNFAGVGGYAQTLTFSGAVDKFKAMHPSVLELEGENMDGYRVYSRDGVVLINDQPCMRLDVYRYNKEQKTNVAAGNYFLSSDGLHLYRFNEAEQTVRELPMNGGQPTAGTEQTAAGEEQELVYDIVAVPPEIPVH